MGFFDELGEKAKKGLDIAGEKTTELVGVARIKYEIAGINSDLGKAYEKLGRLVYESRKAGEELPQQLDEAISGIDGLKARLADAQERLEQDRLPQEK